MSVQWGEHTITDLLIKAMEKQGLKLQSEPTERLLRFATKDYGTSVTYDTQTHSMDVRQSRYGAQFDEVSVKRSYGVELAQHTAQRFGWQLEQKSENKFIARRRF